MNYTKWSVGSDHYQLSITRVRGGGLTEENVFCWGLNLDASGVAALIRSVDLATTEFNMARSIGLRRKRPKIQKGE